MFIVIASMVVLIINQHGVAMLKGKGQPPIAADGYRPLVFQPPLEQVQLPAGRIHVLGLARHVQTRQLESKARDVLCLYVGRTSGLKEGFDALVPEAADHGHSVYRGYTDRKLPHQPSERIARALLLLQLRVMRFDHRHRSSGQLGHGEQIEPTGNQVSNSGMAQRVGACPRWQLRRVGSRTNRRLPPIFVSGATVPSRKQGRGRKLPPCLLAHQFSHVLQQKYLAARGRVGLVAAYRPRLCSRVEVGHGQRCNSARPHGKQAQTT